MKKKSFDVDKFVESIDSPSSDLPELPSEEVRLSRKITKCPRCGAKKWEYMRYSTKGQVLFCSECRHVNNQ